MACHRWWPEDEAGPHLADDEFGVDCMLCLRGTPDAHRRRAAVWERARTRARDRREAEKVVLARHLDELDDEMALRAIGRLGA